MVEYRCEKCGRVFKQKSTYDGHINRKNPCISAKTQTNIESKLDKLLEIIAKQNETIIEQGKKIDMLLNMNKI